MNWDLTMASGLLSAYGWLGEDPSWKSCHNQRTGIDLDGNSTSHQDTAAWHYTSFGSLMLRTTINTPSQTAVNWNKPIIFDEKSVRKDFPVKQEGCFAFKARKLCRFTARSVLFYRRKAKQKETESGHNQLFAFQGMWKSTEMVK